MRRVGLILLLFISFSYSQTFKICDVTKSNKTLLSVDQEYLLKTLYGPYVEAHGLSNKQLIPTNIHPFIFAAHKAYAEHRPLIISPDQTWLLISQGLMTHKAKEIQYKDLELNDPDFVPGKDNEWLSVLDKFSKELPKNLELNSFTTPSFSTTDLNTANAFKVCQLTAKSEQFEFGLFSLCGIPEITLEGKTEDWQKVYDKLETLGQFGMAEWADYLKPVIKEFIAASKGNINKDFWNSFYKFNNECGDASISGWILNFFPYNSEGSLRHLVQVHSKESKLYIPDSDPNTSFPSGRNYLPFTWKSNEKSIPMRFEAGFMGVSQDSKTMALKAEINWALVKRRASGNLAVWQQNAVRDGMISKRKLSAAYSATYIDIDGFENEEDNGLENLKLLEFAIIKKDAKGAFIKSLTELPNFKELECQDWNIEAKYHQYISKLKNRRFTFNKAVDKEFFNYLPETTYSLIFKGVQIKDKYLESLTNKSVKEVIFENCTFEKGALEGLENIEHLRIYKTENLSQEFLSKINSLYHLKSLAVTSCKLSDIPELNLTKLSSIDLSKNRLNSIDKIAKLKNLEKIKLSNNFIVGKPNFNSFIKLKELILHHNRIEELSLDLEELTLLNISSNLFTKLPEIKKNSLHTLIVEKNEITSAHIPESLHTTLVNLSMERVHLSRENAKSIGSMKNLKSLSLKNCDLLNADITELSKLKELTTLNLWTNRELNDQCKDTVIKLFIKGTNISIFDCGFSSSAMDEFAKLREKLKVN